MHTDQRQVATADTFTLPAPLSPAHPLTAGPTTDSSRRQTLRLARLAMATVCAAIFCLLELLLVAQGFVEADVALQTAALAGAASVGFYLLFRSGLNERASDPSLTGPMLTAALAILFSTMAMSPTAFETFGIFIALIRQPN